MVVPLNFTLPQPTELMTPIKAINQGLSTLQNVYQTRAMPQMLQAEMQKNMLSGLPPLDQATMAYTHSSQMLGEDHPTTQALKDNYLAMLNKEKVLTQYQNVLAGAKDFSTLPEAYKLSVLGAGGAAPSIGTGIGLGGIVNPQVMSGQSSVASQNLPQTPSQINKLQSVFGENQPLSTPQINRLQDTGIAAPTQQSAQDIYQKQYSPQAKAALEVQKQTQEAQQKADVSAMNKLFQGDNNFAGYNKIYDTANRSMTAINEFDSDYKKATAKGPIAGWLSSLDPDAQAAVKNAAQLLVGSVGAFKGMGRLNLNEFQTLAKGNLNLLLDPKAEQRLMEQFKGAFAAMQAQSQLAQKLRQYTKDPNTLQYMVNYAGDNYSVVDEKGQVHMENVPKMLKYASPEAVNSISKGQEYFPEDISDTGQSLEDFRNASLQSGIPMGQLITRYRKARRK